MECLGSMWLISFHGRLLSVADAFSTVQCKSVVLSQIGAHAIPLSGIYPFWQCVLLDEESLESPTGICWTGMLHSLQKDRLHHAMCS